MRLTVCGIGLCLIGCAGALPSLSGGRTAPEGQVELGLGAATRVPFGDLRAAGASSPAGVAPVASARVGLSPRTDLGLLASGATFRGELRHRVPLEEGPLTKSLVLGLGLYGGPRVEDDRSGLRVGVDVPLVFTLDASSVVEAYVGPRLGAERLSGGDDESTGVKIGLVAGLGVGFRHVAFLLESTASYEIWTESSGFVLTPACALRLRF